MTKFILNLLIVFSLLFTSSEADLIKSIQEKNGDVYILVRPENGGTPDSSTGLWHFRRTQNYSPSRLPLSNDSRIVAYEGLSVDKFGHVKLFRTNSRENTSLWTLLNEGKIHPDSPACDLPLGKDTYQAVKSYGAPGSGGCKSQPANVATFDSVNFGWSYVINTVDGKEGWYCIYPSGTYAKAYSTPNNGSTPQMINCRFDYDDAKFASWEADADRHAKVVYGLAPNLAAGSEIFPPLRELLIREDTQQSRALHLIRARNGENQLGFWRMVEVILCWVTSQSIIPFAELAVLQGPRIQIEFLLRAEEVRLPLYWVGFGLVTLLDSSQIVLMEEEFET